MQPHLLLDWGFFDRWELLGRLVGLLGLGCLGLGLGLLWLFGVLRILDLVNHSAAGPGLLGPLGISNWPIGLSSQPA